MKTESLVQKFNQEHTSGGQFAPRGYGVAPRGSRENRAPSLNPQTRPTAPPQSYLQPGPSEQDYINNVRMGPLQDAVAARNAIAGRRAQMNMFLERLSRLRRYIRTVSIARYASRQGMPLTRSMVVKANPRHRPKNSPQGTGGQFAPKDGGQEVAANTGKPMLADADLTSDNVTNDLKTRDEPAFNAYMKEAISQNYSNEYREYPTWTREDKGRTKNRIVSDLAKAVVSTTDPNIAYGIANAAIRSWTSIGSDEQLPLHKAVVDEFGANFPDYKRQRYEEYIRRMPNAGDVSRDSASMIHRMYTNTQDMLRRNGVGDRITLYRGVRKHSIQVGGHAVGDTFEYDGNPMASWTTQPSIAEDAVFMGGGDTYAVFKASIPRSRILATAQTGFGAINEHEFVVIHKKGDRVKLVA